MLNLAGNLSCYASGDKDSSDKQKFWNQIPLFEEKPIDMYYEIPIFIDHMAIIKEPSILPELLPFRSRMRMWYFQIDSFMEHIFPFMHRKMIVSSGNNWKDTYRKAGMSEEDLREIEREINRVASRNGGKLKEVLGGFDAFDAKYVISFKLYLNKYFLETLNNISNDIDEVCKVCNNQDLAAMRDKFKLAKSMAFKLSEKTEIDRFNYAQDVACVNCFFRFISEAFSILKHLMNFEDLGLILNTARELALQHKNIKIEYSKKWF